jgi:hypothetical protein
LNYIDARESLVKALESASSDLKSYQITDESFAWFAEELVDSLRVFSQQLTDAQVTFGHVRIHEEV